MRCPALALVSLLALSAAWPLRAEPLPKPLAAGVFCDAGSAQGGALIVFAGWKVKPAWAWTWLQALRKAQGLHSGALACAIEGPQDASYRRKDIDTLALAQWLAQTPASPEPVIVVAHSSGSFVAHHWLQQLRAAGQASLLARVRYYNLDGDAGRNERELDTALISALAEVHAVYATDGAGGESANAAAMRALHARDPAKVSLRALVLPQTGCHSGARWCLHDALITRHPDDPAGFDVARDYGAIGPRHPVQSDYLR